MEKQIKRKKARILFKGDRGSRKDERLSTGTFDL